MLFLIKINFLFYSKVLARMKISVSTDISVLGFYGYIGYIGDISVDIFTFYIYWKLKKNTLKFM